MSHVETHAIAKLARERGVSLRSAEEAALVYPPSAQERYRNNLARLAEGQAPDIEVHRAIADLIMTCPTETLPEFARVLGVYNHLTSATDKALIEGHSVQRLIDKAEFWK